MDLKKCILCGGETGEEYGAPVMAFAGKDVCSSCCVQLVPVIYRMAGFGDGGMIHLAFKICLQSTHNRRKRVQVREYRKTLKELSHKYNFSCVHCGSKENLTVDHIIPVSKGGPDDVSNLQLLCKSCNSRKGNKV